MKYEIEFGSSPVVFPELDEDTLSEAGKNDLALLVYLVSLGGGAGDFDALEAAEALGMEKSEAESAFAFLHGAGIIKTGRKKKGAPKRRTAKENLTAREEESKVPDENKPEKKVVAVREAKTPHYSGIEAEKIIKENNLRSLIEECQVTMGKMFGPSEINVIVELSDYLGLSSEHILLLFAYCHEKGKNSVRFVEKTAFGLYDEGIDTAEAMEEFMVRWERNNEISGKFRNLIGREGDLSKKEEAGIDSFCGKWGFDFDVIKYAYDITVENTGKYTWKYMERVIQNWIDAGYKNESEIRAAAEAYNTKNKKSSGKKANTSFDTDEFFEKAVVRSKNKIEGKKDEDK